MKIPAFKYYFPPKAIEWIIDRIQDLLKSGDFLSLGMYVNEIDREFAKYVGSKHAIAVTNGTTALEAIFRAIDVRGHKAIIPTNTFAATAYAVIHSGGKPVFTDIENDMNFSVTDIKRRLTPEVKVVVPVHVGGLISPRIRELIELAENENIYVVEDAAHAHGSMLNDRKAGTFGVANAFSFFSTKVMTTGEGGMITTDNDEIAEKVKLLRDQAKVKGNLVGDIGHNWRMTEFQAIVGLAQLRLLEEIIEKRNRIASFYNELLEDISALQPLKIPENVRHNYYKYIVFLRKGWDPERLRKHLGEKYNVSLAGYVYEVPLHRQPPFKQYINDVSDYPVADDLCTRHIALPIYPQMTEEEIRYVIESLKQALHDLGWI
jgi:dTDP-4-amino-4,6-dideoxygalactose transaminase